MDKETKIIKRIQKLVPEIMELKKGCSLIYKNNKYVFGGECILNGIAKQHILLEKNKEPLLVPFYRNEDDWYEILGRDITLENILLAIWRKGVYDKVDFWLAFGKLYFDKRCSWLLNKPFHEQNQETKDFIGDLLLSE